MTPEQHQRKAERIERSLAKCSVDQPEIVIEGVMLAGTHWFNIALHRMGFSSPEKDVMHAQYLPGNERLKLSLLQPALLQALDEVESFRPAYVRGNLPGARRAATRSLELLNVIKAAARRL